MAIVYNWEILSYKTIKQKIASENDIFGKENKRKRLLFAKTIRFIWPKPKYNLFEWKIIAETEKTYTVRVRSRHISDWPELIDMEELKERVHFKK